MDEFPSNSRRSIGPDKTTPAEEEKIRLEKVVTGKVIRRKKPLGRRLKEALFSGENVVSYLLKEVLVPALQATLTDMVVQGVERAVYGEVRSPNRSTRPTGYSSPRTYTSYDRPSNIVRPTNNIQPRRNVTQPSAIDIGEIIVESKIQAQIIAEQLYETVEKYGTATVGNLNDLIGQSSVFTDHKWGWTDLKQMSIERVREGYLLVLPPPEDLR